MAPALPLLLALALTPAGAQVPSSFTLYAAPGGDWSADAPAGWAPKEARHESHRSVMLVGGLEPNGLRRPALIIGFFPGDHPTTPTPEEYIKRMSKTAPEFKLTATRPARAKVAGISGKRFRTSRLYSIAKNPFDVKEIRIVDEWVVIPAYGGFYALQLSSGEATYPKLKPAYERFLKSFKLTGAPPPR